jgi:TetR/AcrR family transcriptional repressor of nem operon
MPKAGSVEDGTAGRILDVAEGLVQTRGFNGFSYADIAAELGITKAGLHYHFASKAELGQALIERYADRFAARLAAIDERQTDATAKLDAYAGLYGDVLRAERMCLCGMLAAEFRTLPEPMREAVTRFFEDNEAWVERVLELGRADGTLRFTGRAREVAQAIVSGLEGAMLVARPHDDVRRFRASTRWLIRSLSAGAAREP